MVSDPTEETSTDESQGEKPSVEASPAAEEPVAKEHTASPKAAPAMGSEEQETIIESESDAAAAAQEKGDSNSMLPELDEKRSSYPWYVVHTYSGYEQRAKLSLEERVKTANASEKFGHVVVPHEKVVEVVRGEKKTSSKKVFPGYILIQCEMDDESWHLVKGTPKITGFVGDSRNPVPLSKMEVETLMKQMEGGAERPRPSVQFEQGDSIKVVDGPFADFNGTVDEVKPDKGKLRVLISIFGRNTPVELDFVQVEKV